MAALLLDLGPGDEVIMPSFTFVSTANAFVLRGATPVFVDVRADTLNLDEALVEPAITPRTKAIVAVHYAGVALRDGRAPRDRRAPRPARSSRTPRRRFARRYRGRPLGTLGDLGALSFHETKNVICGEGGALLVNDRALLERAEIVREKGTNRCAFLPRARSTSTRGWTSARRSCSSELAAAFLWAQLEQAETDHRRARSRSGSATTRRSRSSRRRGCVRRPSCPRRDATTRTCTTCSLDDLAAATRLSRLRDAGVYAVFHYVPLHSSAAGRRFGRQAGELPVTDRAGDTLLRLPCGSA